MIGLPTETKEDLEELVTLVEGILAQGRKHGRKEVNVSVGPFVPKSWTPFQWAPFDGVELLDKKLGYLKERFRRVRGVKFDGWSEHFRYDLWNRAFETEGIPKSAWLRAYDVDEVLPWDVLDASITKRFLKVELVKAKKEMRTEDCKWGHCYACGVPGNGEDTVLATSMQGTLPTLDASVSSADDPAAYREVAKGAAYRQKAMPDLPSAVRRSATPAHEVFRHRITFEKSGDARFLS